MTDSPDDSLAGQPLAVPRTIDAAAALLTALCVAWSAQAYVWLGLTFYTEQLLALVLGLAVLIAFLHIRLDRRRGGAPPWYDVALGTVGVSMFWWIAWDYEMLLYDAGQLYPSTVALGIVVVALTLEALRRTTGYMLLAVVMFFILYAFIGSAVPGRLRTLHVSFPEFFVFLGLDSSATFGSPLKIGAEIVVAFIFFGQLLVRTGGGQFFTDLAMATMGRRRGGAAKVAVVASAMFGSISGSPASNVASTGIVTIPLMVRSGYSPTHAGAIEAVASTGGAVMPPIMGAAAFLMAEYLQISYAEVLIAAIVPSLLYYFAVFVQVDLLAGKARVAEVAIELPRTGRVLAQGWHFIVPFAVLLVAMFEFWVQPQEAALWAGVTVIALGAVFRYGSHRMTATGFIAAFYETGRIMVELVLIVAAAGMIIGILSLTGLSFALTFMLVQFGGGSLAILLLVGAVLCIVLGLGMPVTGVYVLLAFLIVPALVESGVVPIAAHMFIFYFGLMSMITPPVAICAFTAATISGADAMETAFVAMKLAWTAYIVPFLFVLSPTLLLIGDTGTILLNIATAAGGVYLISAAVAGFFARPLSWAVRLILVVAGIAALTPASLMSFGEIVDFAGLAVGAAVLWRERAVARTPGGTAESVQPPG